MTPATTTMSVVAVAAMLAPSVAYVPRERRGGGWVDRRGTKRKRHGKVAVNRARAKAARAARRAER